MLDFLSLVVGVLLVAGLLFLGASLLMGRGETQLPADRGRSPAELPEDRPVLGDDVRALRLSPALRGYRMSEVDWLIDQFAQLLDERDAELAALRRSRGAHPPGATATKQDGGPGSGGPGTGDSADRAHDPDRAHDHDPDEEHPHA